MAKNDGLPNDITPDSLLGLPDDMPVGGSSNSLLDEDDLDIEIEAVANGIIADKKTRYPAKLVDLEKTTAQSGNEQLLFKYRMFGDPDILGQLNQSDYISLLPQVRWKLDAALDGLGAPFIEGSNPPKRRVQKSALVGKFVYLTFEETVRQGTTQKQKRIFGVFGMPPEDQLQYMDTPG